MKRYRRRYPRGTQILRPIEPAEEMPTPPNPPTGQITIGRAMIFIAAFAVILAVMPTGLAAVSASLLLGSYYYLCRHALTSTPRGTQLLRPIEPVDETTAPPTPVPVTGQITIGRTMIFIAAFAVIFAVTSTGLAAVSASLLLGLYYYLYRHVLPSTPLPDRPERKATHK
jgi:hypothetical protein